MNLCPKELLASKLYETLLLISSNRRNKTHSPTYNVMYMLDKLRKDNNIYDDSKEIINILKMKLHKEGF